MNIVVEITNGEGNGCGTHVLEKIDNIYKWRWIAMHDRCYLKEIGVLPISDGRRLSNLLIPFKEKDLDDIQWK